MKFCLDSNKSNSIVIYLIGRWDEKEKEVGDGEEGKKGRREEGGRRGRDAGDDLPEILWAPGLLSGAKLHAVKPHLSDDFRPNFITLLTFYNKSM